MRTPICDTSGTSSRRKNTGMFCGKAIEFEQHEPRDAAVEPLIGLERQQQRHAAAERMTDQRQVAQILVLDELGQQLGLIVDRIASVERLVRLAEALEVDGDDPVALGELGGHEPPRKGARAEAMDEEHGRALALFAVVELDRRVRRPEPGVRTIDRIAGTEPARAERKRKRRKAKRQLSLDHPPSDPRVPRPDATQSLSPVARLRPPRIERKRDHHRPFAVVPRFGRKRQSGWLTKSEEPTWQFGGVIPSDDGYLPALSIDAHKIPCYPIIARSVSKWGRLVALLRGHGGICAASPTNFSDPGGLALKAR